MFVSILCALDFIPDMNITPGRISKCATITLNGAIEKIFPLFGPIMEKEWAEGWDPEIIYSKSGLAEEHMIFRTKAHHPPEAYYTWVITQFNPGRHQIEYTVSTDNRIWFIRVECMPDASKTMARVCYTYTSLTAAGHDLNRQALEEMYAHDLKDWEEAINYYLKTGKQLTRN
jgi:hypothetical protein